MPINSTQIASEIRIAGAVSRRHTNTSNTTAPKKMLKVISVFISDATPDAASAIAIEIASTAPMNHCPTRR